MNLDHFINKSIINDICEVYEPDPVAVLPQGTIFTGEIAYSDGIVYAVYIADMDKPVRNFRFKIVKDNVPFTLQYNYRFVGSKLFATPEGPPEFVSLYVEKEL